MLFLASLPLLLLVSFQAAQAQTFGLINGGSEFFEAVIDGWLDKCEKLGITLFTVSHRASLRKYVFISFQFFFLSFFLSYVFVRYHKYELHFNGSGGWVWSQIGADEK